MSRSYRDIFEERDYYSPRRAYDDVEVLRRREPSRRREPEFLREDYGKTTSGPLVVREREEFLVIRPRSRVRERSRPREREVEKEDIIIRRGERPREIEKDEFIFRRGERPREREIERDDIVFRRVERETITIRRGEREEKKEEKKEPEPIREPPIHKEVITHLRTIDHGIERIPPPKPKSPSPPPRDWEEIEIRRRGSRPFYDDDIIIERETNRRHAQEARGRRRSLSGPRREREREIVDDVEIEADYYNRRAAERAYIGEAFNGATRDWAIVDVPPGTKRVQMDGIGGASQEVTWQRYNGVRRSKFIPEADEPPVPEEPRGRPAPRPRPEAMWTEITKDLVVREAIERMGYEFEETEYFFYVIEYLHYEDVLELVELSEDIRRDRRDRMYEIQWERERLNRPAVYDDRVFEREVIYEGRRPGRYR
ncbi:hypothetical protein L228DRAFT_141364 [Xylona heveae TC161]|uniref:DUF8035 domain-containing protein n=1 Tax=Xylona heveae (strain CBS 132557 / TC161) TaxID=1328760 RepID=A0A165H5E6_XYLHT|nr:hypothetical protein L228DRAFT_141364 [Xylona heveae TC161]KZF23009.1 hypothetical protein L228DRAFT_141364 [Xylona heveae TC161]